jgi:superfamily II DNA or RNA helicase
MELLMSLKTKTRLDTTAIEIVDNRYFPGSSVTTSQMNLDYFTLARDDDGLLEGVRWRLYSDDAMVRQAKKRGAAWSAGVRFWMFAVPDEANKFFEYARKKHPDWEVRDVGWKELSLGGVMVGAPQPVGQELASCEISLPVPASAVPALTSSAGLRVFHLSHGPRLVMIGQTGAVERRRVALLEKGATDGAGTAPAPEKVQALVETDGWAVPIRLDLDDPLHLWAAGPQDKKWAGGYPSGVLTPTPWDGVIHATRKTWPAWRDRLSDLGIGWHGDDPEADIKLAAPFNTDAVPGWHTPAPNGHLLHAYQKVGASFCASRGMRALIGDEMGVGKTAQAIAAAEGTHARRVFVVCPSTARFVWEREIKGWGGGGAIQHIQDKTCSIDPTARWHILTYEQISPRAEIWMAQDQAESVALSHVLPGHGEKEGRAAAAGVKKYPLKVRIEAYTQQTPAGLPPKRAAAWEKMMQRLRGDLVAQIVGADGGPLVIFDEAHRVKNKDAKRTVAARRIADAVPGLLMLTGTPLRNNEQEAKVLLGIIDHAVRESLDRHYAISDVKDALTHFMIRRTKAEVLPELPEKTRQRIDLASLDQGLMENYRGAMNYAFECHAKSLERGNSQAEARKAMQGGLETARNALGQAKVMGGDVEDLVLDVVENQGCCVVFCAHHAVSDAILARLNRAGLKAAVLDGRTAQVERARLVGEFQDGRMDVLIGGINAAGESITLTRASTVIFVELDWVPAALLQAEDRIHRVGQRANCQVIHLIAKMEDGADVNIDEMMIDTLDSKAATIAAVLGEDADARRGLVATGSGIQGDVISAILASRGYRQTPTAATTPEAPKVDVPVPAATPQVKAEVAGVAVVGDKSVVSDPDATPSKDKRPRGRPRIYIDGQAPSAATMPEAPKIAPEVRKVDVPVPAATPQVKAEVAGVAVVGDKSVVSDPGATPSKDKRPRGRPRIYIDGQAPTSGARTQRSLKALADAGGKRLMLRLAPDSMAALREIMTVRGIKQETTAINTLIQEAAAAGKAA